MRDPQDYCAYRTTPCGCTTVNDRMTCPNWREPGWQLKSEVIQAPKSRMEALEERVEALEKRVLSEDEYLERKGAIESKWFGD